MKKSKFTKPIAGVISVITILTLIGTVGALNGWFGGGGKIPEDTFTRGLVAYWSFDEGSGTTAYDASGNGNHGTLINGPKWTQGKIGGALSFDGVDDYVNVPNSTSLQITDDITIEAWIKIDEPGATDQRVVVEKPGSYRLMVRHEPWRHLEVWLWLPEDSGAATLMGGPPISTNTFHHIAFVRNKAAGTVKTYVDGVEQASISGKTSAIPVNTNSLWIGKGWNEFDGLIDEVRIYNRALSPEEIRFHYSRGGPVAYWKFDEGQGTKVYDLSGNGNNGTLNLGTSGNTDPSKAWVPGKFGTALSFDGVDDYVSVPDSASLRSPASVDKITVSAWIYHRGYNTCEIVIARKTFSWRFGTGGTWASGAGQNSLFLQIWSESGTQYNYFANKQVTLNQWHHVVAVWDGSNIYFYIDGQSAGSVSHNIGMRDSSDLVYIGRGDGSCQGYFNGLIDEVRIYNYARTPDEIRLDYNAGYAARFGPSTDCNSDPGSCMTKGLVAYWSFDEGSGNIAYDSSGNGNHGTIYGAKWTQGKFGQALSFDGVDDYVDTTAINITGPITITLWVKLNVPVIDKVHTFVNKYPAINYWMFAIHQFEKAPIIGFVFTNAGWQRTAGYATALTDMKWHFLAAGYDGTKLFLYEDGILKQTKTIGSDTIRTSAHTVKIGGSTVANEWLNGLIDEVRIYNRALSENEIRYHYNHTLPKGALSPLAMKEDPSLVGYWSFNEGKGTIIYDQSGKNNNGTLYLGSSGNTDPSKAWSPGISGTALSFDGVDDYVLVGNPTSLQITNKLTVELWIKANPPTLTIHYPIAKHPGWGLWVDGTDPRFSNNIGVFYNNTTAVVFTGAFPSEYRGKWVHIAFTYDKPYTTLYVNGKKFGVSTDFSGDILTTANLNIGRRSDGVWPFGGLIDEVRIYNRALSEQEILEHYRNSKYYLASHFGPKTNCREDPGSCIDYGLVGYWSFDEGAGTTAYDASGKGNNGTLVNGPKWTNGKFGQALSFDGVDDYVRVSSSASLKIDTSITLSMWFRAASLSSGVWKVPLVKGGSDQDYSFQISPDNTLMWWASDLSPSAVSFGTITTGIWYHAVAVYEKNLGKIFVYLNGTLKNPSGTSVTGSITHNNLPLDIGSMGGLYPFNGTIDEVRIYNRALSEEEIRYLYNRGGPIAHWKFDEGKGNIAYDSSGNGNNGTIYGAQWVQGKFGSALSFDGVDDYVDFGNPTSLNITGTKLTLEAWVYKKTGGSGYYPGVIARTTGTSPYGGYMLSFDRWNNRFQFSVANSTTWQVLETNTAYPDDGWYYIVGVYDAAAGKSQIYVNGKLDGIKSVSGGIRDNGANVYVGRNVNNYWNGLIDDVRIYNYARTPEQILQDYNAGLSAHFK